MAASVRFLGAIALLGVISLSAGGGVRTTNVAKESNVRVGYHGETKYEYFRLIEQQRSDPTKQGVKRRPVVRYPSVPGDDDYYIVEERPVVVVDPIAVEPVIVLEPVAVEEPWVVDEYDDGGVAY